MTAYVAPLAAQAGMAFRHHIGDTTLVSIYPLTAALALNDTIAMMNLPLNAVILDMALSTDTALDTNVASTLSFDVGDAALANRFFSILAQGNNLPLPITRMTLSTGLGFQYTTAAGEFPLPQIIVKIHAAPATAAVTGNLKLSVTYSMTGLGSAARPPQRLPIPELASLAALRELVGQQRFDEAVPLLTEYLDADFFHDEALFLLGACLQAQGRNGLAAVVASAAIDARQAQKGLAFLEAMGVLGAAYKSEHRNETALRIWRDALKHESLPRERAKILTNMSGCLVNAALPEKAIECCDLALAEDAANPGARANRGLACLQLGRWREGWEGYAATYQAGDRQERQYPGISWWDGSAGKRVIVFGDQGIGDELYFASCLPDMIDRCSHVILDCHPRLARLFRSSFPQVAVHGTRKIDPAALEWVPDSADAAIGLSDLPRFFRNADQDWPGEPFLKAVEGRAHPGAVDADGLALSDRRGSLLRIGLAWTGGSKRTQQQLRSIPLLGLLPILRARADAAWFSLQYTADAARAVCELEERTGIRIAHYPGWVEAEDYGRTASFVASLDLVISVTTAVHDLTCGLGVPNWVMVPKRTSWRFQRTGDTLPWYGSARLFRQECDGDWSNVIAAVAAALVDFTPTMKGN